MANKWIGVKLSALTLVGIFLVSTCIIVFSNEVEGCFKESELIAGQNTVVGNVEFLHSSGYTDKATITYTTKNGWEMTETHLAVGSSFSDIPTNKKGNPKIGKFPFKGEYDPAVTQVVYNLDLDDYSGITKDRKGIYHGTLYIAAHAVVEKDFLLGYRDGKPIYKTIEETAWGDTIGIPFNDNCGWAMYFIITF